MPVVGSGLSTAAFSARVTRIAFDAFVAAGAAARCDVAAPRAHGHARPRDAQLDLPEPAVTLVVRRIVAEHVVAAGVGHEAIERLVHVVAIDGREAAGFIGQRLAEAVLRQPDLVERRLDAEPEVWLAGDHAGRFDQVARRA